LNFSTDTENGNLNLVMRFENELTEWCLLKAPSFVFGALTAGFSVASLLAFAKLEKKLKIASAFAKQKRRLLQMGLSVSLCMMTSLIASALISATLEEFSQTQDQLRTCESQANPIFRDYEAYGYEPNWRESCCMSEGIDCSGACPWICWDGRKAEFLPNWRLLGESGCVAGHL
jgi:hypothetical protein